MRGGFPSVWKTKSFALCLRKEKKGQRQTGGGGKKKESVSFRWLSNKEKKIGTGGKGRPGAASFRKRRGTKNRGGLISFIPILSRRRKKKKRPYECEEGKGGEKSFLSLFRQLGGLQKKRRVPVEGKKKRGRKRGAPRRIIFDKNEKREKGKKRRRALYATFLEKGKREKKESWGGL